MLIIELWNAGRAEVRTQDYEDNPIRFEFGNTVNILNTDILDTSPPDLKVKVYSEIENNNLLLKPLLLNKGDKIRLKVLVDGYKDGLLKVHSRIAGVKQVELINRKEYTTNFFEADLTPYTGCGLTLTIWVTIVFIFFIMQSIFIYLFNINLNIDKLMKSSVLPAALLISTIIIVSFYLYSINKRKKKEQ